LATYEEEYKQAVANREKGIYNGLSPTEIDKKYGKYTAPTVDQKYSAVDNYRKNELDKVNSGYYDNADNRRQWLTPNEQKLYDSGDIKDYFSQSAKGPSKYDDWGEYFAGKENGGGGTNNQQAPTASYGGSSRAGFNPSQRNALAYSEAADRAKQQLDPLYERAVENVRKERYQNELNASQISSARGLSHSGLAADQLNKVALASQSNISDLDAKRASQVAEMAQRMVEYDQDMALRERAAALSEYLGVEGLNLNREQFDFGKYTNQRDFDYAKALDERNFGYQQSRDARRDAEWESTNKWDRYAWQQQFDYGKQRDAVGDNRWNLEFQYGQRRDGIDDNYRQQALQFEKSKFSTENEWRKYVYNNMSETDKVNFEWNKERFGEEMAWQDEESKRADKLARDQMEFDAGFQAP
jgi:hypothetical protein